MPEEQPPQKSESQREQALLKEVVPVTSGDALPPPTKTRSSISSQAGAKRAEFLDVTKDIRKVALQKAGAAIKASLLADPDMWDSVRKLSEAWMDQFYLDVENEVERNLEIALLYQKECEIAEGPQSSNPLLTIWYAVRRWVLRNYLPHDRSIFGKLNNVNYLAMYLLTAIPIHGLRVAFFSVLLMAIVFPFGKGPDEFQLVNYILLFKGMQFLTGGLMMLMLGATEYFMCYSFAKDELLQCIDRYGPGSLSVSGQSIDYAGSVLLCWVAFALLAKSTKPESPLASKQETKKEAEQKTSEAGGRLRHLLIYDMKALLTSLCLLIVMTLCTCGDYIWGDERGADIVLEPQFRANFFWACVVYSVLMLPFFFFMVPGLQTLLIHCDATGYNDNGACVLWELRKEKTTQGQADGADTGNETIDYYLGWASSAIKTVQKGANKRGGELSVSHIGGDFMRGLFTSSSSADHQVVPAEPTAPSTAAESHFSETLRKGREARGGDADGGYEFGDFTRGIVQRMQAQQGNNTYSWWEKQVAAESGAGEAETTLIYTDGAPPESVLTLAPPLRVDRVVLDPQLITMTQESAYSKRKVYYDIQVFPAALGYDEMDAELGISRPLEPWHVMRRYTEFHALCAKMQSLPQYRDAPFPPRIHLSNFEDKVAFRREALEKWLNKVVEDEANHPTWSSLLRDFLRVGDVGKSSQVSEPPSPGSEGDASSIAVSVEALRPAGQGHSDIAGAGGQPQSRGAGRQPNMLALAPPPSAAPTEAPPTLQEVDAWLKEQEEQEEQPLPGSQASASSAAQRRELRQGSSAASASAGGKPSSLDLSQGSSDPTMDELPNWYGPNELEGPPLSPNVKAPRSRKAAEAPPQRQPTGGSPTGGSPSADGPGSGAARDDRQEATDGAPPSAAVGPRASQSSASSSSAVASAASFAATEPMMKVASTKAKLEGKFNRLLQEGKEARGADAGSGYQFGDLSRAIASRASRKSNDEPKPEGP
mmetsp:Transcript_35963/g.84244  ORF Transcript_35963/g.84244 Transcript_35963/m.84244 type:complete len:992 (-) Transcript_35963:58-3033(-)